MATQVFSASDCVRYRWLHVLEKAGQRVLAYTLQCGTPYKSTPVLLDQYLNSLPQHSTARYKNMSGKERKGCFNKTDTQNIRADPSWSTFDVSLLFKAITCSCEGWQEQDDVTLRLVRNVKEIKDKRNAVVHETFTTVRENDLLTELCGLKTLFHSTLTATKDKYNTDDSECDATKTDVDNIIDDIRQNRFTDRQILQRATADLLPSFKSEADEELRRALDQDTFIDPLHFLSQHESDRVEAMNIFTPVTLTENINGVTRPVQHSEMLSHTVGGSPRLILVEGDAGSGKTTLLAYTVCEYLKEESECHMEGLHQYDLLLRVVCREETTRTLQDLLKRLLPDAFYKYGTLVMPLVRHSRVLVQIDGLDEQQDYSRDLVKDILNQGKDWPSLTLLATSRPEAVRTTKASTPSKFVTSHLWLEGISQDRRTELALQYHEWLCADKPRSDAHLRQVMEQIGWKDMFRLPLNIVFLAKIVAEGSEGTIVCESNLYQKILDWCVEKLKDRLLRHPRVSQDAAILLDGNIKSILRHCCRVSYEGLLQRRIYLSDDEVQQITKRCNECGLPASEILPAFYSLRRQVTKNGTTSQKYHSPHKSLQDFMAARHVMESLNDYKEGDIRKKLDNDTPGKRCDLRALRQMLRHLLGLLSHRGETVVREAQETVGLIKDSGVNDTWDWLNLLADTKVHRQTHQAVAECINGSSHEGRDAVIIHDNTVSIATALLPLITTPRRTKLWLEREPGETEQLAKALHHHKLTEVKLRHHYRRPCPGVYSDHWLHQLPRSDIKHFEGHLDDRHLDLLPQSLTWLYLSLSSLDHANRLIPSLVNLQKRCWKFTGLCVHIPVSTLNSTPSTTLPHGLFSVHLDISGVGDKEVDLACDIIAAMSSFDSDRYESLSFPLASLMASVWKYLTESLASRKVTVMEGIQVPHNTVAKEEEEQLNSLSKINLECRLRYESLSFPLASLMASGWKHLIESLASRKVTVMEGIQVPHNTVTKEEEEQLNSLSKTRLDCRFRRLPSAW